MNMGEMTRFMLGLKIMGLTAEEINNFIVYIGSGDEKYKPQKLNIQR